MRSRSPRSCRTQWGAASAQPRPSPASGGPISDLYSFPFQKNTSFNTGPDKGHVGHPCPAGDSDTHQRVWSIITRTILPLVWQAVVPVGANRAVRRQPDPVLGVPVTKDTQQRLAVEYRPVGVPTVNDKSLGSNMWGGSRTGAGLYERTLGRGRAGQQHLVTGWHAWVWRRTLQHVPDAAFRQLQFWRGIVCR